MTSADWGEGKDKQRGRREKGTAIKSEKRQDPNCKEPN